MKEMFISRFLFASAVSGLSVTLRGLADTVLCLCAGREPLRGLGNRTCTCAFMSCRGLKMTGPDGMALVVSTWGGGGNKIVRL